ncbi:MAG: hypothetical protein Ct9H300mP4_13980 [Gammaproteobacteria bacterium]|nr:MAG: hypothetical protein Ct9H300mP4_13980 [Gammaproteobacteria bacterium]
MVLAVIPVWASSPWGLALRGAHVMGTGRTLEKASKACSVMPGKTPPVALELSSLQSIVECAEQLPDWVFPSFIFGV